MSLCREMDIVRNGEREATNYFFSLGDAETDLELTYNLGGHTYDIGTGYGHIAITVDDLDATLARSRSRASSRKSRHTRCVKAARGCASSAIRTATASS